MRRKSFAATQVAVLAGMFREEPSGTITMEGSYVMRGTEEWNCFCFSE
jgi:hypothetical protein